MADWNHPVLTDSYSSVLTTYLTGRDTDAITMQVSAASNPPVGAFRYVRASDKFQEWNGSAYVDKVLSLAGGGTGATSAGSARTALGLGSMATQDNNAVNITGGAISGVTMSAAVITSGTLALARGGTGASLALGSSGQHLQSNGTSVVFSADGSALTSLNASNLSTGTVPLARLPAQGYTVVSKNANYTVTTSDINSKTCIECNGTFTLSLPAANDAGISTPPFGLRVINVGTGVITISPASGTIIGALSYSFDFGQYSSIEFFPDSAATDWRIF